MHVAYLKIHKRLRFSFDKYIREYVVIIIFMDHIVYLHILLALTLVYGIVFGIIHPLGTLQFMLKVE